MKSTQQIMTQEEMTYSESHLKSITKHISSNMKTSSNKKTKSKMTLCNCKSNIWNLQRRYRRIIQRAGRTSNTYGLLRA